jgi:hypothetical protein
MGNDSSKWKNGSPVEANSYRGGTFGDGVWLILIDPVVKDVNEGNWSSEEFEILLNSAVAVQCSINGFPTEKQNCSLLQMKPTAMDTKEFEAFAYITAYHNVCILMHDSCRRLTIKILCFIQKIQFGLPKNT